MPLINFFNHNLLDPDLIRASLINKAAISKKLMLTIRNNCSVALAFKITEMFETKNVNKLPHLAGLPQNIAIVTCRFAPF